MSGFNLDSFRQGLKYHVDADLSIRLRENLELGPFAVLLAREGNQVVRGSLELREPEGNEIVDLTVVQACGGQVFFEKSSRVRCGDAGGVVKIVRNRRGLSLPEKIIVITASAFVVETAVRERRDIPTLAVFRIGAG